MTRTMHLTVDPDGRVAIPGAKPGQTVTVENPEAPAKPEHLTLATARTEEERDAVIAGIKQAAREFRAQLSDDEIEIMLNHGAGSTVTMDCRGDR